MDKEQKAKRYADSIPQFDDRKKYCIEDFCAGWDEALKSQFRKCINNKPIKGQEPNDGENVILLCQMRGGRLDGYIFPKANTFKNGDWEGQMLMRYNVIAWMPIPSFEDILQPK